MLFFASHVDVLSILLPWSHLLLGTKQRWTWSLGQVIKRVRVDSIRQSRLSVCIDCRNKTISLIARRVNASIKRYKSSQASRKLIRKLKVTVTATKSRRAIHRKGTLFRSSPTAVSTNGLWNFNRSIHPAPMAHWRAGHVFVIDRVPILDVFCKKKKGKNIWVGEL